MEKPFDSVLNKKKYKKGARIFYTKKNQQERNK
jgi:hypothetical protein